MSERVLADIVMKIIGAVAGGVAKIFDVLSHRHRPAA